MHAIPDPPPPLASDVRIRGRCLTLPKGFRESLKLEGPVKLQATVREAVLELRPDLPCRLKPKEEPPIQPTPPSKIGDLLKEAFEQVFEETKGCDLITEASLNARGQVALDQRARHFLGWHTGDRIRVVLEEDHLRLIRVDLSGRGAEHCAEAP